MTTNDAKKIFNRYMSGDVLNIGDGQQVEIDTFAKLFADAPSQPTKSDLDTIDNGDLGYSDFLNQAQTDGVLT